MALSEAVRIWPLVSVSIVCYEMGARMFAVFEDGSRQYKVRQGDVLAVDLRSEAQSGQTLTFDQVLIANGGGASVVGRPVIEGASVTAEVVNPLFKGIKLEIQHFHRRNASKKHTGHRQKYTQVKITGITVPGIEVVAAPVEANSTTAS
jgi:large subunit ribosomal protein L21